jgi:hypothetical protein
LWPETTFSAPSLVRANAANQEALASGFVGSCRPLRHTGWASLKTQKPGIGQAFALQLKLAS